MAGVWDRLPVCPVSYTHLVQDAIDTMIASGAYAVNDPMSAVERFQKKTCLNRVLHQGDKVWEENAGRWEDEDAGNVEVTAARQKITASLEPLIVGVSRVIDRCV